MSNVKPRDLTHDDKPIEFDGHSRNSAHEQKRAVDRQDGKAEQASAIMRHVTVEATREIDRLIEGLKNLRVKLEDEGSHVQRNIADYLSLGQSIVEFTKIVSAGMAHVNGVSEEPSIDPKTPNSTVLAEEEQKKEAFSPTA